MDNSRNLMNNDKSLCLYCDKAFSNTNDQENHVERDHKAVLNKAGKTGSLRKSERITKNSSSENSHFAACFYCNNKKIIRCDDLESLFQHLLTAHKDIYFGCKCRTRVLDKTSLANHRKNCKIGGGKNLKISSSPLSSPVSASTLSDAGEKAVSEKRKPAKRSQSKSKVDAKCDNNSESESISTAPDAAAATTATATTTKNISVKSLPPTNAINKKSDRSNVKNSNGRKTTANHHPHQPRHHHQQLQSPNDRRSKSKNLSTAATNSSNSSSSRSSSSSKASDEYTIPLTRQKLKAPVGQKGMLLLLNSSNKAKHQKNFNAGGGKMSSSSSSSAAVAAAAATSSSSASEKSSTSSLTKVQRTKTAKVINQNSPNSIEAVETVQKNEVINAEFDDDFYKNISQNIRVNLNCHIDGKVDRLQLSKPAFDRISASENAPIKSEYVTTVTSTEAEHEKIVDQKPTDLPSSSQQTSDEKEIHESTNFELSTPFPALLTVEQYGFGDANPNKNKRQITKNSWKWKWDLIKKYKYVNEGGKIVKKVKQITTGLKDLSQLDMWTQLSMRSRYENLNSIQGAEFDDGLNDSLSTRMIKTQNLEQLNNILDKRLKPEINIEQLQQTLVKEELIETECIDSTAAEEDERGANDDQMSSETLAMFKLAKTNVSKVANPALSGEWARPRCFVCVDCGQEFDLMKSLNDHKNSEHPYVVSAHYEVVGRENLEQKLYRNLFLPKKALQLNANTTAKSSISINSDSKSNDATSTSESSSNYLTDQKEKECTKCMKTIKYSNDIDIYRHILDCIEDRVWMQAKKRSKYRRSRRKSKKNMRKSRLSTDQKKSTSSPFQKDNTEGENSTLSISNPPTPKEDKIPAIAPAPIVAAPPSSKVAKLEPLISDASTPASNDGMNIKSFFRVSKTTPNLPQKIVVQMLEMPPNNGNNNTSLRHSLRSSAKKQNNNNHHHHHQQQQQQQGDSSEMKASDVMQSKKDEKKAESGGDGNAKVKEQTISEKEEIKNEVNNTDGCVSPTMQCLPALQINDSPLADRQKPLTSPTNSSSALVSPTSNSTVPKKKKKLNDCIAMLTCKIQEKLGVNFFENTNAEVLSAENAPKPEEEQQQPCKPLTSSPLLSISPSPPCKSPSINHSLALDNTKAVAIANDIAKNPIVPQQFQSAPSPPPSPPLPALSQAEFECPEQEEVIDLSVKKKPEVKRERFSFPALNDNDAHADSADSVEKNEKEDKDATLIENPTAEILPKSKSIEKEVLKCEEVLQQEKKDLNECATVDVAADEKPLTESEPKEDISHEVVENKTEAPAAENNMIDVNEIKDTLKISIAKNKIPNLDEILKENHVITVNNLKISDAERRAFEEQKNRIRQILSKTKKTATKKQTKKSPPAPVKKQSAKKTSSDANLHVEEKSKADNEKSLVTAEGEKETLEEGEEPNTEENQSTSEGVKETIEQVTKVEDEIKVDVVKSTPKEEAAEQTPPISETLENKIQAAIKSTNRIRCRRLSVVVDPIINLSAFQQTNRKIRLTNNSQQNGFYDLLTNDHLFNAIRPQLKDEIQKSVKSVGKNSIKEAIEEVLGTKAKPKSSAAKTASASNAKPKAKKAARRRKSKFSRKSKKSKASTPKQVEKKEEHKPVQEEKKEEEEMPKPENEAPVIAKKEQSKAKKGKQQSEEKKTKEKTPVATPKKTQPKAKIQSKEVAPPPPAPIEEKQKSIEKQEKNDEASLTENKAVKEKQQPKKKLQPSTPSKACQEIEQQNVENQEKNDDKSIKKLATSARAKKNAKSPQVEKEVPPKRAAPRSKTTSKSKAAVKELQVDNVKEKEEDLKLEEKLSLDISLSSDTSNENDIPLAQLIASSTHPASENKVPSEVKHEKRTPSPPPPPPPVASKSKKKSAPKKTANRKNSTAKPQLSVGVKDTEAVGMKKDEHVKSKETSLDSCKKEPRGERKVEGVQEKTKKTPKETAKTPLAEKMEIFDINEDSFFNDDDNDVDQADEKINDLVNNIINSSELIDSESEKIVSDKVEANEKQEEAKCHICKKSFKNEKVLEKHNTTSTHLFKQARRERRIAELKEKEALKEEKEKEKAEKEVAVIKANENPPSTTPDEIKIFRTKGALKTFDNILPSSNNHIGQEVKSLDSPPPSSVKAEFRPIINACSIPDVKEFRPVHSVESNIKKQPAPPPPILLGLEDDENDDLSRKDKIFDSLFSNIENKLQAAAANAPMPPSQKFAFPSLTPQESEVESSSTSWDLQHDADIEWDGGENNDNNNPTALAPSLAKEKLQKKPSKQASTMSIPTKSLIMGKIFKKHRDREKQKTPQADAPNNKPGIKNSLDEIFDHLKNSEIDDKVLTCPSPKTLLKSSGSTFSPRHSNDMLETASQSNNNSSNNNNNNIYSNKPVIYAAVAAAPIQDKPSSATSSHDQQQQRKKKKEELNCKSKHNDNTPATTTNDEDEDGIGVRKSRRRCAIKAKTFAETWSSDEYEELHDTNDIISIINEIEKRESNNRRRKSSKSESLSTDMRRSEEPSENHHHLHFNHTSAVAGERKQTGAHQQKKSVQLPFPSMSDYKEKSNNNSLKKRRMSTLKDGHRSDEETFTATKDHLKPLKPNLSAMKKRRMSCFVPSTAFNDSPPPSKSVKNSTSKHIHSGKSSNGATSHQQDLFKKQLDRGECAKMNSDEKIGKGGGNGSQKKVLGTVCNNNSSSNNNNASNNPTPASMSSSSAQAAAAAMAKKKAQKHRKRPRTKVKNIAYDSDSDFELNISKKSKNSSFSSATAATPKPAPSNPAYSDSGSEDDERDELEEEEEEEDVHGTVMPTSQSGGGAQSKSAAGGVNVSATTITTNATSSSSSNSNTNELTMIKEPKLLPNDLNVVQSTTTANAAIPEDIIDPLQSAGNRTKRHSSEKLYYWSSSSSSSSSGAESDLGDTADGDNNEDSMIPQQPEQHGWIVGDSHKKLVTLLAHAKIKNKIN